MTTLTIAPDADAATVSRLLERRAGRYTARHLVWDLAPTKGKDHAPALRKCGRVVRSGEGVEVRVSTKDGARTAGFSGLASCGSVWACPVCSGKIAAKRQSEIERALTAWGKSGGRVALATFTVRHHKGDRLKTVWDAVSAAWHAASSGAGWQADQLLLGTVMERTVKSGKRKGETVQAVRVPTIRVIEVTHGANGWHVHVHVLLLVAGHATGSQVEGMAESMFRRWSAAAVSSGLEAPTDRHGYDARLLEGDPAHALGEYFTKSVYSASMETARGDLKDAKGGNRTMFGVLRGLVGLRSGEMDPTGHDVAGDEGIWGEWERGSKGRRQVAWTPGLRDLLLPDEEEQTDQEIVEEAPGGEVVDVIEKGTVRQIMRHRADWQVLAAFSRSNEAGWTLVAEFCAMARAAEEAQAASRVGVKHRT